MGIAIIIVVVVLALVLATGILAFARDNLDELQEE